MRIRILAFGRVAEIIGKREWVAEGILSTDALQEILIQQFPALEGINYALLVNKKISPKNSLLTDGETVALLPPFSGG